VAKTLDNKAQDSSVGKKTYNGAAKKWSQGLRNERRTGLTCRGTIDYCKATEKRKWNPNRPQFSNLLKQKKAGPGRSSRGGEKDKASKGDDHDSWGGCLTLSENGDIIWYINAPPKQVVEGGWTGT